MKSLSLWWRWRLRCLPLAVEDIVGVFSLCMTPPSSFIRYIDLSCMGLYPRCRFLSRPRHPPGKWRDRSTTSLALSLACQIASSGTGYFPLLILLGRLASSDHVWSSNLFGGQIHIHTPSPDDWCRLIPKQKEGGTGGRSGTTDVGRLWTRKGQR